MLISKEAVQNLDSLVLMGLMGRGYPGTPESSSTLVMLSTRSQVVDTPGRIENVREEVNVNWLTQSYGDN